MKKNKYFLPFACTALFLTVYICCVSSKDEGNNPAGKQTLESIAIYSVNPPASVDFCGKTIMLDRYDVRERFDREINVFAYMHSTTMLQIKRANRYFPVIEPILKKYNIPDDFKYLAVIESMLDVRAYSPAQAAGLWQFLARTGKEHGLAITEQIDERYHVEKSTEAACRYFQNAYNEFGNWMNVVASYNAGIPRIKSELKRQRVNDAMDLLLVDETSRYMFRLLAIKEVFSNPCKYGFILKREDLYPVIRTKEVKIHEDVEDFSEFAEKYGINYYQLKNFNVWLRDRSLKTFGKTYIIQIPLEKDMFYNPSEIEVHDKNWIAE